MTALRLVRVDFDNTENESSAARVVKELGVFVDDDPLGAFGEGSYTASGKIDKYLHNMDPVKPYLGWDSRVYPYFKIESVELR